jgi:hypothetical protein
VREVFSDWLGESRPDLTERYAQLYSRGAYLPADERRRLGALVRPERASRSNAERFQRSRAKPRAGEQAEHAVAQRSRV